MRRVVPEVAAEIGFEYSIQVLNITVAALMAPAWIAKRVEVPPQTELVMVPGYCEGDLEPVRSATGIAVERGPRDLRNLSAYFGRPPAAEAYGDYDIEILAEINCAARLPLDELLAVAGRLRADGADLIDVGCEPGGEWRGVGEAVQALRDAGHRVSIDSLNIEEIAAAAAAGAELVLSVNSSNREAAVDWGCEVVAIPDDPKTLAGLDETVAYLANAGVPLRIDPVLEPIPFGFAQSLGRYLSVRRTYPEAEMLMGIGNLTELTDVDSAGVNALLLGFCQELGIRSVLTTQVINWARTSTRECDLARRLMYHAVRHGSLPKHIEPRLILLRDPRLLPLDEEVLQRLAESISDHNYRLFADGEQIHLVSRRLHLRDADPFRLFAALLETKPENLDAGHAFYLGFEICKALTANTLGKQYEQDQSLEWGFLTADEDFFRLPRTRPRKKPDERTNP